MNARRLVALHAHAADITAPLPVLHPADPLAGDDRRCDRCGCLAAIHAHYSRSEHCGRCGQDRCPAYIPEPRGWRLLALLVLLAAFATVVWVAVLA